MKICLTAIRSPRTPQEKEMVKREIDHLVYELYGLTEDEFSVVKGDGEK